jgi:dTDP-4-dehydrorhamnose 3,5-epimerase
VQRAVQPGHEHGIHPLDPDLDLPGRTTSSLLLSDKDAAAPTLAEAQASGLLPDFAQCEGFYASLRGGRPQPDGGQ